MRAVAAADQKNMPELARFDGFHHCSGMGKNRLMGKTGGDHMAAVDAAHAVVMVVAAQRKSLLDQGRKVLAPLLVRRNVRQALVSHHGGGIHPILITGTGRHQTVGGKQHRRWNILKLGLLALPRRAEIARQMRIFFQTRIAMGRQHFAVRINVDPLVLRLFQQLMQIFQIMAGYHDERPLSDVQMDFGGDRIAERSGIGPIQQFHAPEIDAPEFHNQLQPVTDGTLLPE